MSGMTTFEWLSRHGTEFVDYYFIMDNEVYEWKPRNRMVVKHRFYDSALKLSCVVYLSNIGRVCRDFEEIGRLAMQLHWPDWGKTMVLPQANTGQLDDV